MIPMMRRLWWRFTAYWERRAALSRGPTYEAARDALGGAPWREAPKSTDAWYILDDEAAAMMGAPAESRRRRIAVAASLALVATVTVLFFVARSYRRAPDALAVAALAPAPATPAPAPAITPVAPETAPPLVTPDPIAAPVHLGRVRAAHHVVHRPAAKKHAHR